MYYSTTEFSDLRLERIDKTQIFPAAEAFIFFPAVRSLALAIYLSRQPDVECRQLLPGFYIPGAWMPATRLFRTALFCFSSARLLLHLRKSSCFSCYIIRVWLRGLIATPNATMACAAQFPPQQWWKSWDNLQFSSNHFNGAQFITPC